MLISVLVQQEERTWLMGLPGGKTGRIWDSQTLPWVSDATVVCINAAKSCFD